jgi:ATP-binding cassette subfamily B protein
MQVRSRASLEAAECHEVPLDRREETKWDQCEEDIAPGPKRPITKDTLRRVVRTFLPYRVQVIWTAVAVLASAGLGILPSLYLRTIIGQGLIAQNMPIVTRYTIYTLLATIGATALSLGYGYLSIAVGQHIMRDLRNQLFGHLQGMSLRFFTATRTGEIQSRLANDVNNVQSVISDTAASLLNNVTVVISTLVTMIYMDWRLTLLSVGILPIFALIAAKVGDAARGIRGKTAAQLADLNATMQENLSVSGVLLTKVSGRQTLARQKFTRENETLTESQIRLAMIMRSFFNLIKIAMERLYAY